MMRRVARATTAIAAAVMSSLVVVTMTGSPATADSYRDQQWHLKFLDVAAAHKISTGSGVTVAVIDSGAKADHPDLVGNVLPGVDLTGSGGNGQQDESGHGTAMAALIAGHGHGPGNGAGVLGIAPSAKIYPIRNAIRLLGAGGTDAAAVNAAIRAGAKVLSISQGWGASEESKRAIQTALAADIVVVAASGNKPDAQFMDYPAAYPGVIAVGATGKDGNVDPVTVTGKEMVLTAPGRDIVSADKSGEYRIGTGTSDATAIVAGAAALVRSKYPKLSAQEVVHRLTATATDKGAPGRDPEYGYGALNLVAALQADVKPESSASGAASGEATAADPENSENAGPGSGTNILVLTGIVSGGGLLLIILIALAVWFSKRNRKPPQGPPGVAGYGPTIPPQQGYPYGSLPHSGQSPSYGHPPVPLPPVSPGQGVPPPPGFGNPPYPQ